MDKRAAAQYLKDLFGTRAGHVAVAYKDTGESWQEHTFEWPKGRAALLKWAEIHQDANIFICPALRKGPNRVKGDMLPTRWLWADVDWDKVPQDKRDEVRQRIGTLGTLVVKSGTGENVHVYVEMDRNLTLEEHRKLNTGLRDYLYADAKHADNSLLRLPGTTNWKTKEGTPVTPGYGASAVSKPEDLLIIREFKNAKVVGIDVGDIEWKRADVEGLPRRILRMVQMPTDEAKARYGKRHKAVWAITGELHKRGLDRDQIHTLMDQFPAAIDKNEDEHNGYDVHKDVEKRLIWDAAQDPAIGDEPAELSEAEEEGFEDATEEDDIAEFKRRVEVKANEIYERRVADRRARQIEAELGWTPPPVTASRRLTDILNAPADPTPYLIEGMATARGNVVITAQYKTGKTAFLMGALARSLADAVPFLDQREVHVPEGGVVVGHWNLEMDETHLADTYIRPAGYENSDNLVVASLRGYRVNLLSEVGKTWTVQWLRDHGVKVWTIDSIAQLARMAGVSENANEEMGQLLGSIDEIKREAGVDAAFLIAHTGRAQQEEGRERARAATIIDDWPDSRWVMTRDSNDIRYLQIEGRDTAMKSTSLEFDEETKRYTMGGLTKIDAATDGWVQGVVRVLAAHGGPINESGLVKKLKELGKIGNERAKEVIHEAEASGWIEIKHEKSERGGRAAKMHYLVSGPPPEDRNRRATPQEVNMTQVKVPKGRRASM
jgi:hypothetical protein